MITATNPTTKERIRYDEATQRWVPMDDPTALPDGFESDPSRSLPDELMRQGGLALRHAAQGLAGATDPFTGPIRSGMNMAGIPTPSLRETVSRLADDVGLPKPETPLEERVATASEFASGSGGFVGLLGRVANPIAQAASAAPAAQITGGAAAGYGGELAKQEGFGPVGQFSAAVLSAVAGGMAPSLAGRGADAARTAIKDVTKRYGSAVSLAERAVDGALLEMRTQWGSLPAHVRDQLVQDVASAVRGGNANPEAIRRLVEYRLVGATPTRGPVSGDPVILTQQRNLEKMGANASQEADDALATLAQVRNQNESALKTSINRLGPADDVLAANEAVKGALSSKLAKHKEITSSLYAKARDDVGRSAQLDPAQFTNKAGDLLKQSLSESHLPASVRSMLNDVAEGKIPLTVDVAEQIKTALATQQRSSSDGNVRHALGLVRQALDDTDLMPGQGLGKQAIDAFNKARKHHRLVRQMVEKTPALKAIEDDIAPDQFVQKFVIRATDRDSASLTKALRNSPEAQEAVRSIIIDHLKQAGLGSKSEVEEVANWSAAAFARELKKIGPKKLGRFFSPQELRQLYAIRNVGAYEAYQPTGSAINNSNTAAMVMGWLDRLRLVPGVGPLSAAGPIRDAIRGRQASQMMNPLPALMEAQPRPVMLPPGAVPAILAPGLLAE